MLPLSADIEKKVEKYLALYKGKAYAPLPHPELGHIPFVNGPERFDMIYPHLRFPGKKALDIGTHLGYLAHRLDDAGYEVTAVELSPKIIELLRDLRQAAEKSFNIVHGSVFDLPNFEYEVVVALNIFHHFLKTEKLYNRFLTFLSKLECRQLFFQAHIPSEKQMASAFKNYDQWEFAAFLADKGRFESIEKIGVYKGRHIFKLER